MKICNQCEAINVDNARFCCKCGNPLGASVHGNHGSTNQQQYQNQQPIQPMYRHIGFGDAIHICLKEKYASFDGRATRGEYWYFYLFCMLVAIGGAIIGGILGALLSGVDSDVALGLVVIVYCIIALGMICPGISVLVRRLHDTGRSGWWYWLALIPYVGGIVIFIFTLLGSQEHDNEYGPYVR